MIVKLGDYVDIKNDKKSIEDFSTGSHISTDNMLNNKQGVFFPSKSIPRSKSILSYEKDDILISNIRPYFKKIWKANCSGTRSADVLDFKSNNVNLLQNYLYVVLQSDSFFNYVVSTSKGTKMPRGDKKSILNFKFYLPKLSNQIKISNLILSLENKINLNNQINDNLSLLSTSIFNKWLINTKSNTCVPLSEIAKFQNGLAMQKYKAHDNSMSYPVLKIKELNQGFTDESSDRCSINIPNSVIINKGDIVFSWSGTLKVKMWQGSVSGLNQHLFKITSKDYPKWFYYEWTKHYLKKFKLIAASKATTMGHIRRADLDQSTVTIPTDFELNKINLIMNNLINKRMDIIYENEILLKLKNDFFKKLF